MIDSIALQEIHDGFRARAREIAEASRKPDTDWQAMWHKRGARLMQLAADLEEMTRQRDMLARRCAEQARQIAALVAPFAPADAPTVHDAIRKMQDGGGCDD